MLAEYSLLLELIFISEHIQQDVKKVIKKSRNHTISALLAPPARLERTTFRLGGGPSILVRYGGICKIFAFFKCSGERPNRRIGVQRSVFLTVPIKRGRYPESVGIPGVFVIVFFISFYPFTVVIHRFTTFCWLICWLVIFGAPINFLIRTHAIRFPSLMIVS